MSLNFLNWWSRTNETIDVQCLFSSAQGQYVQPLKWLWTYEHWLIDFIWKFWVLFTRFQYKTQGIFLWWPFYCSILETRWLISKKKEKEKSNKETNCLYLQGSFFVSNLWFLFLVNARSSGKFSSFVSKFIVMTRFYHPYNKLCCKEIFFQIDALNTMRISKLKGNMPENGVHVCIYSNKKLCYVYFFEMFVKCFNKNVLVLNIVWSSLFQK